MTENAVGQGPLSARPRIGSVTLCLLTSAYIILVTNYTFWSRAAGYLADDKLAFIAFVIGVCALMMAVMTIPSAKYLIKPALI